MTKMLAQSALCTHKPHKNLQWNLGIDYGTKLNLERQAGNVTAVFNKRDKHALIPENMYRGDCIFV